MAGLERYERGICECGFHESLTGDKSNVFRPGVRICPVCAGFAQYGRMHAEEDQRFAEADKNRPAKAPRPEDGRRVHMRLLSESEAAEVRASASVREQGQLGR